MRNWPNLTGPSRRAHGSRLSFSRAPHCGEERPCSISERSVRAERSATSADHRYWGPYQPRAALDCTDIVSCHDGTQRAQLELTGRCGRQRRRGGAVALRCSSPDRSEFRSRAPKAWRPFAHPTVTRSGFGAGEVFRIDLNTSASVMSSGLGGSQALATVDASLRHGRNRT